MSKKKQRQALVTKTTKKEISASQGFVGKIKDFYFNQYKKLFLVLVLLTLISAGSIFYTYQKYGDFTQRDVSLKGGISLTVNRAHDINGLSGRLTERFPDASLNLRTIESGGRQSGFIIEASDVSDTELAGFVESELSLSSNDYSHETMGSSLGDSFFREMFIALAFAFLLMGMVFHFYFRNIYATAAALLSALLDLFITLGIMNILDVRLTAGGIAAYLMLIGYSVDTSILLSTKMLKDKKDSLKESLFGAMKTGLTMSAAGIAATGISFILTNNFALKQIMLILIVGLIIDIATTWIGNVTFLRIYLERKDVKA